MTTASRPAANALARVRGEWSPAVICLAVALCASGILLIVLGSHLVFEGDDWARPR